MNMKPKQGGPERLTLNTLTMTRKSFSRIVRAFNRGEISEEKARALGYLFSTLCSLFKAEQADRLEERITALELSLKGARV